jgi:hypothetical protein
MAKDKFQTWLENRIKMLEKESGNRSHGYATRAGIGQKVGEATTILEAYIKHIDGEHNIVEEPENEES